MTCPHTDSVVARHLDGDVLTPAGPETWQPGDVLADHLRDCTVCQDVLQRSRRLDAVLAEASGRATSDLDEDPARAHQLVERAIAAARAAPGGATRARRWHRQLLVPVLLVALGFCAAWWLAPSWRLPAEGDRRGVATLPPDIATLPAEQTAEAPPAPSPAPSPAHVAIDGIALVSPRPVAPAPEFAPAAPRSRAEVQSLSEVLGDRALADRLQLSAALQLGPLGVHASSSAAAHSALLLQQRCSETLLDAAAGLAVDAWIHAVAGLDEGPLLDLVLADARRRERLASHLRMRLLTLGAPRNGTLDDLALLTVAARVGGRTVDGAIRQALRRTDLRQELAAALRLPVPRDGRAALLLDVWADAAARGGGDDETMAQTLFLGQPSLVAAELAGELARSRDLPRRVRCLLAFGVVGTDAARDVLVRSLRSPVRTEAEAAAYALGQLPADVLRPLLPLAARTEAWLLRAACCCARLPEAERWLQDLDLTPAERALLRSGNCTFAQFPVLASLLRDRSAS